MTNRQRRAMARRRKKRRATLAVDFRVRKTLRESPHYRRDSDFYSRKGLTTSD